LRAGGGVVAVEVVVEPVVVPVPAFAIPVQVTDVQIAIRVAIMCRYRPHHCPLKLYPVA